MGGWGDEVEGHEVRWKERWKMGRFHHFTCNKATNGKLPSNRRISMVIFILAHLISIAPLF